MGVDVEIKARLTAGSELPEPLSSLRERFIQAFPLELEGRNYRYPDLGWDEYDPVPTLEVRTLMRYYGLGYERGHWPDIRAMGDWLVEALGDSAEVRYGGDSAYKWDELSPWAEARAECEARWNEAGNEPYHAYFRRSGNKEPSDDH